jgi:hypothetical protein
MEWQQIEEKWMEMAMRLQTAQPTAQPERTPSDTSGNESQFGIAADPGLDQPDNGQTLKSPALA